MMKDIQGYGLDSNLLIGSTGLCIYILSEVEISVAESQTQTLPFLMVIQLCICIYVNFELLKYTYRLGVEFPHHKLQRDIYLPRENRAFP